MMKKKYVAPTFKILNCLSEVFDYFGEEIGFDIYKECFEEKLYSDLLNRQ